MSKSTQAVRATTFINSIGVQLHLAYTESNVPYSSLSTVEAALAYLNPKGIGTGVSTVRDDTWAPTSEIVALGRLGYKLDIYTAYNSGVDPTTGALAPNKAADTINALNPLVDAGYVRMIEGPLEPDNYGWGLTEHATYTALDGKTYTGWNAAIKWQQDLYNTFACRTDVALFSLAVPQDGAPDSPSVAAARSLCTTIPAISERGNVHFFQKSGNAPIEELPGVIQQETGYTPGMPFAITETGFNDLNQPDTNLRGSEYSNGVYTLDLVLDAYKLGSDPTIIYELFDENMGYPSDIAFEDHWGLFHSDGTPKLSATYLRNMISVLGDTGACATTFRPGRLDYTISGFTPNGNGNSLLMQKSNGAFDLAVWADANVYTYGVPSTAPTQNVTVCFQGVKGTAKVYDPVQGCGAVQTFCNVDHVTLGITDHPLIVEFDPCGPAPRRVAAEDAATVPGDVGTAGVADFLPLPGFGADASGAPSIVGGSGGASSRPDDGTSVPSPGVYTADPHALFA